MVANLAGLDNSLVVTQNIKWVAINHTKDIQVKAMSIYES